MPIRSMASVPPRAVTEAVIANRREPGGFTLLELLVVLVIIAALAGIVAPGLGYGAERDLDDTAERLVALINRAQQEAVLSSRIWQVTFDLERGAYQFRRHGGEAFHVVTERPFSGGHTAPVEMEKLTVNGQSVAATAGVYLFPTGEQDSFRLTLRAGSERRVVSMGPVGPSKVAAP